MWKGVPIVTHHLMLALLSGTLAMTLELAEALLTLGRLPGEKLPSIAIQLLESGHDTPAVRTLAGLVKPTLRDAQELFEQIWRELGRPPLEKDTAASLVATDLASKVLSGEISPRNACRLGASLAVDTNYHPAFIRFYYADDEYDLPFRHAIEIDRDIVEYCRNVVANKPLDVSENG